MLFVRLMKSIFLLLLSGCIVIAPTRFDNDGSDRVTDAQRTDFVTGLVLEEVGPAELQALVAGVDPTWLVMWAPWCAYCLDELPQQQGLADQYQLRLRYVSSSYHVASIRKHLGKAGYTGTAYILSADAFGTDKEFEKLTQVHRLFYPTSADTIRGLPQHYLFRDGRVVAAGRMRADSLARHFAP